MKIGDRVFVRGYIDEIRKDTVIIRNAGGYFGTIPSEVITGELPSAQPDLLDDGTLMITVPNGMLNDVKRVMVDEVGTKFCKVMYQDAERKKGRWIETEFLKLRECSCCHVRWGMYDVENFNYCPNCGADMMTFPNTVEEFMDQYKITDTKQIYTNGAELVPIFRMKQWFNHKPEQRWIPVSETVDIPEHEVLACDKYEQELIGFLYENNEQWMCECEEGIMYDVVAWMEKPEPYKGDTE